MLFRRKIISPLFISLCLAISTAAMAEQSERFGNYVVHYNALQTDFLTAKVAREYGIKRSRNRAMLNIAVQKKDGQKNKPVEANVTVTAVNLSGQLRTIKMRPVRDGTAIYYIGETSVSNRETLRFNVVIKPANSGQKYTLKYSKQFFTR